MAFYLYHVCMPFFSKKSKDTQYIILAYKIFGDFSVAIIAPVVFFVYVGQKLDTAYDKAPLFTILGFVLAAFITMKYVTKRAVIYGKQYQDVDKKSVDKKRNKNITAYKKIEKQ